MTIGVWTPNKGETLSLAAIDRLLSALPHGSLEELIDYSAEDFRAYRSWMSETTTAWAVCEALEAASIQQLIRFFTLAERDWSGWEAGKSSPVIPLVALLKRKQQFEPDFRRWIKQHTDNRYLPNGAVL